MGKKICSMLIRLASGISAFGGAIFEVENRRGHAPVIFGEKEDKCLLGVTALEALGLEVDVATGKLKPMELLLL